MWSDVTLGRTTWTHLGSHGYWRPALSLSPSCQWFVWGLHRLFTDQLQMETLPLKHFRTTHVLFRNNLFSEQSYFDRYANDTYFDHKRLKLPPDFKFYLSVFVPFFHSLTTTLLIFVESGDINTKPLSFRDQLYTAPLILVRARPHITQLLYCSYHPSEGWIPFTSSVCPSFYAPICLSIYLDFYNAFVRVSPKFIYFIRNIVTNWKQFDIIVVPRSWPRCLFSGNVYVLITVIESCLVTRTKSIITVILFGTITIYVILYYIMFLAVVLK